MEENKLSKELVLFESKKIRRTFYEGEWYYSIVDIIGILTESVDGRKYWNKLKQRLKEENDEVVTNCHQLKLLASDGKQRLTDCATREIIFRIIQSVPSKNAEPFKLWFAHLAEERVQEVENPSLAIERAKKLYENKGYTKEWINARIKGIPVRKELVSNWKERGALVDDYSILTNELSKFTFGITIEEHKEIKRLSEKTNLRDNMSPMELVITMLAETTTNEIHNIKNSQGFEALSKDVKVGGNVAKKTINNIEEVTGKKVVTSKNSIDFKKTKEIGDNKNQN